jgi:hypothetical protein
MCRFSVCVSEYVPMSRSRECVCVVYVSMFFMCCVSVCSCICASVCQCCSCGVCSDINTNEKSPIQCPVHCFRIAQFSLYVHLSSRNCEPRTPWCSTGLSMLRPHLSWDARAPIPGPFICWYCFQGCKQHWVLCVMNRPLLCVIIVCEAHIRLPGIPLPPDIAIRNDMWKQLIARPLEGQTRNSPAPQKSVHVEFKNGCVRNRPTSPQHETWHKFWQSFCDTSRNFEYAAATSSP